jgi:hypothetical protein
MVLYHRKIIFLIPPENVQFYLLTQRSADAGSLRPRDRALSCAEEHSCGTARKHSNDCTEAEEMKEFIEANMKQRTRRRNCGKVGQKKKKHTKKLKIRTIGL